MTPIDFGVTRSKVKVTVALNGNMISTYYLGYFLSQSRHISHFYWLLLVDYPIDFKVTRSKVKVTGALNGYMISGYYHGHYISQSLHISLIDWSLLLDDPH
jgi:hypothetical protein